MIHLPPTVHRIRRAVGWLLSASAVSGLGVAAALISLMDASGSAAFGRGVGPTETGVIGHGQAASPTAQSLPYVCPMHSDVRAQAPGSCPRCGMALVHPEQGGGRDYLLDLETLPRPAPVGRPVRLRLTVRDPATLEVVRNFAVVHDKRFHLFLISRDLGHYEHVHPEQGRDGAFSLEVVLPRPGVYQVFADFLPEGGTPQVNRQHILTAGASEDVAAAAHLVPDQVLTKTVAGMSVTLRLPPEGLMAGRDEKLVYRMADARTGAPVTDLEPYLGAWGHTVIVSEDTQQFVHAHPSEHLSADAAAARGGPELTFKAQLPKPGHYRVWTQIKRQGDVSTAVFTVTVAGSATTPGGR